jgi:hypothetical protein
MVVLKNRLERRFGEATDFIGTETRIHARRMYNRGESSTRPRQQQNVKTRTLQKAKSAAPAKDKRSLQWGGGAGHPTVAPLCATPSVFLCTPDVKPKRKLE